MTKHGLTKWRSGAVAASATGASASGAASVGAIGVGALAIGAVALGALAIGRLSVGRARLGRVEIGELRVARLDVGAIGVPGKLTEVSRVRAAPGQGDEFEGFLADRLAEAEPGAPVWQAQRSVSDPDLFLIHIARADTADAPASGLGGLLDLAVAEGLAAPAAADRVELYRTI